MKARYTVTAKDDPISEMDMPEEGMNDEANDKDLDNDIDIDTKHWKKDIKEYIDHIDKTKKLLFEKDGVKIYEVDGAYLRDNVDIDFFGGHHWVEYENSQGDTTCHDWIPEDEIWVDEALPDKIKIAKHELEEMPQMEKGKKYEPSHSNATEEEQKFRDKHKEDKVSLIKQIEIIRGKK